MMPLRDDGDVPTAGQAPPILAPLGDVSTDRLTLRRFQPGDLDELCGVFAQPEVWRFPLGRSFTCDETESFLRTQMDHWSSWGFGLWVVRLRADDRVIGYVGLSVPTFLPEILPAVEVGWRLEPAAWGNGYATEGATAALDEAFGTLGLDRVCCIPQRDNLASVRVAERLGLQLVREVDIPANPRRGAVRALLYEIDQRGWPPRR
jgi:RimJ/RimL family protein N-acetyltransferase